MYNFLSNINILKYINFHYYYNVFFNVYIYFVIVNHIHFLFQHIDENEMDEDSKENIPIIENENRMEEDEELTTPQKIRKLEHGIGK